MTQALLLCLLAVTPRLFLAVSEQSYVQGPTVLRKWFSRRILSLQMLSTTLLSRLTGSDVRVLEEQLSAVESRARVHEKQARQLESRLTQEQIKLNKASMQIKRMVHHLSDESLLGVNVAGRFKRAQLIRTSLLSFLVLWRQNCLRAQHLRASNAAVSMLEEKVRNSRTIGDNLRLDNILLKIASSELQQKLEKSEGDKSELKKKLVRITMDYRLSLLAREAAARSWIKHREAWQLSRERCMRPLLLVIAILWRFNRHLGARLMDQTKTALLAKAHLARLQKKYDDVASRHDAVKAEHDNYTSNIASLVSVSKRQTKEINELRLKIATHEVAFRRAVKESVEGRVQLQILKKKHNDLRADCALLADRCEVAGRDLSKSTERHEALENDLADHVRSSGLSLALLARHLHQERIRMEEEKLQEFRPVYDMMTDLRSRLAMADDYVQKMVSEPSTPAKTPLSIETSMILPRMMMLPSPPASATPSPMRAWGASPM